jgi:hypothetical protein
MVSDFLQQSYHESTASNEYYPVDGTKSETDDRPDDSQRLAWVGPSGLQNQSVSRVRFAKFSVPYLRRVLPERFGISYNRGITCTRSVLLDGWAHEPVHHNLSLLRERNIER